MKKHLTKVAIFLLAGAVVNVAVAWGCIAGQSTPWEEVVEFLVAPDTDWLRANGIAIYEVLEERRLRQFGLLDSEYSAQVEEPTDRSSGYYLYARRTRCGWPFLSLDGGRGSTIEFVEAKGRHWYTDTFYVDALFGHDSGSLLFGKGAADLGDLEYLPVGPIWPGFAVNTLFYATLLWPLIIGPFVLRRLIRQRRGLCPACGYDLRHGEHKACPECGVTA